MSRINKTAFVGGCGGEPWSKVRTLSRSFDTLEQAQRFADGKNVVDVYKSRGRFKVEWQTRQQIPQDD